MEDPDNSDRAKSQNPNRASPWGSILSHVTTPRKLMCRCCAVGGRIPEEGERERKKKEEGDFMSSIEIALFIRG